MLQTKRIRHSRTKNRSVYTSRRIVFAGGRPFRLRVTWNLRALRAARVRQGLTIGGVAQLSGLSTTTIRRAETMGPGDMSVDNALRYLTAIDVSVETVAIVENLAR